MRSRKALNQTDELDSSPKAAAAAWTSDLPETVQQARSGRRRRKKPRLRTQLKIIHRTLRNCLRKKGSKGRLQLVTAACTALLLLGFYSVFLAGSSTPSTYSVPDSRWPDLTGPKRNLEISVLAAKKYAIQFPVSRARPSSIVKPPHLRQWEIKEAKHFDHGGLEIKILEEERLRQQRREIYHNFEEDRSYEQLTPDDGDDDMDDFYYAFDDDAKRNPLVAWDDPDIQDQKTCRRTSWHRDLPINCNNLHEFDVLERFRSGDTKYLGAGAYREVYLSKLHDVMEETVAFKAYYWGADYSNADFEYMRMDAIVAERLTWSPRIVNIYAFCGTGMINEAMENGDIEDVAVPSDGRLDDPPDDKDHLIVRNKLTPTQKLEYALDMAEAVLLLHSFPDGVIVHDDIQLSQFLLSNDGTLKLNDFNRAEIMLFNEKDNEYCGYRNNPGRGDWRSPEEYEDKPLNEQIDIWSLGNNMYSMLTGLYPLYMTTSTKKVQKKIMQGETGYIDPRYRNKSFAEKKLAEIIPLCWVMDPDERIDIFRLVEFLRNAVQENKKLAEKAQD